MTPPPDGNSTPTRWIQVEQTKQLARPAKVDERLFLALVAVEEAEQSLRSARALIRQMFGAAALPKVAVDA